ncbi:MAG: 3'-5' exonuclease [Lactobacillales bacterium]|jgi:DNA polymerase-3 subunit epsilon|nr:3'-5' exonuclease [Lactobacillales bacterium]
MEIIKNYDLVMTFDTETTGLDAKKCDIIEFAGIVKDNRNGDLFEIGEFVKLDEGEKIPAKITEITHITDAMLAQEGIARQELADRLANLLESTDKILLVAHNIQFDIGFMISFFNKTGHAGVLQNVDLLDTLTIYKDRAEFPHRLSNAIEHYGLTNKFENSHRAIDDVRATRAVMVEMIKERNDLSKYINLVGYNPKYGISGQRFHEVHYKPQPYNSTQPLYL